ncbi:RIO1-domain-containing protein [Amylocystis lapponica]|nr:RIO1-domain-containing protein [Amylocystis lapponica]
MSQTTNQAEIIEDGQFDDAPEAIGASVSVPSRDPREGHTFIDEEGLLAWSSQSDDGADDQDAFDAEEDAQEAAAFHTLRAEDEDWEIAERDFTKQYNRLRQHVAVRTGAAQGFASSINARTAVASLPAVNRPRNVPQTTSSAATHVKDKTTDQLQALSKYSSRLRNIDMPYDLGVGVNRKGPSATANFKDKSDRATNEQVLDPRTRIILFKMIGRGLVFEVNGCVSTGKEANVYHALTPDRMHLALKIYKTSILVFKDRDRYVSGEYRFRRGYSRHNPRKMVRVWAEKEMRNLKRLRTAGIRCPDPVEVRENVLVMGFVGDKEGWASPRLKDAEIAATAFPALYVELLAIARKIFVECKLVHADLSEYNVLYHVDDMQPSSTTPSPPLAPAEPGTVPPGHLYIIDVSQSVEHDHPHAFDFLRADLHNIEDFFSKRGVQCVGLRRAFEFVTREDLVQEGSGEDAEAVLRRWMEEPESEDVGGINDTDGVGEQTAGGSSAAAHEDSVFRQSYIPRTLNEVYDPERDVGALSRGEGEKLIYRDMIGLVGPKESRRGGEENGVGTEKKGRSKVQFSDGIAGEEDGTDEGSEDADEDNGEAESDGEADGVEERRPRGHRHEDKEAKKERKQAVKAEAREKRQHKIPKGEKKRKVKATARGG